MLGQRFLGRCWQKEFDTFLQFQPLVSRIRHFGDMSDDKDSGGGGSWYKVPVWDGSPQTFRAFKKEMAWRTQSLDLQSTKKFNLAARWLLRQTGIARQRGEEFDPQDLAYKPAVVTTDRPG